jgi:beta-1,4-mannosyl-glycoprotein beta-1,4-N-acetylglucosaminyltransferase
MIDCFPFFNELDLLEVRLHALSPFVDRFVLAECPLTHSGNPKPLFFEENKARFDGFDITHVIVPPRDGSPWELETWGRECLLEGIGGSDPEEMILISDVDEIPDPEGFMGEEGIFSQRLYYYFFNCFTGASDWRGTMAQRKKNLGPHCIDHVQRRRAGAKLPVVGGGWHFSTLGSAEQILFKIESFAHQELNTARLKDDLGAKRNALVNWGEVGTQFSVEDPSGPRWLLENRGKYPDLWVPDGV